jgi:hypothetical protein
MFFYLKKAKQTNLSISLYQCHELRAGNQARFDEVMAAVGPHVDIVMICGSDTRLNDNSEDRSDAIKPLGEGDYDPKEFLSILKKTSSPESSCYTPLAWSKNLRLIIRNPSVSIRKCAPKLPPNPNKEKGFSIPFLFL